MFNALHRLACNRCPAPHIHNQHPHSYRMRLCCRFASSMCQHGSVPGVINPPTRQPTIYGQTSASYGGCVVSAHASHTAATSPLQLSAWCYRAVHPPSMDRQAPVMEAASSLHRWRTSAATSSTRTKRFVGWSASSTSLITFSCTEATTATQCTSPAAVSCAAPLLG